MQGGLRRGAYGVWYGVAMGGMIGAWCIGEGMQEGHAIIGAFMLLSCL
jgi:hypothetical protein